MNASIASRAGMSRWFVGSSSSSRFDGWMPEQGQLEPRPLAARQRADLLERVVAAEQEPGQVAARLARPSPGSCRVSASRTVVPGIAAPRSWAR